MKNKRIASIVLAMTLVLSTFSTVFAADFDIIEVDGTGRYGFTKWTIDSKLFSKITISPQKYFIEYGEENYELDKVMEKMNDGKSFEDAIAELEPVEEEDEGELKVVSVSAINVKQVVVKFSKAVDEDTIISNTTIGALQTGAITVSRTVTATDDTKNVTTVYGFLSKDGKTLTLTADETTNFDGTYAITVTDKVKDLDGNAIKPYAGTFSMKDETNPVVSEVKYDPVTNKIIFAFSEPIKVVPNVIRLNGNPVSGATFVTNSNHMKLELVKPANIAAGTTVDVYVGGSEDYAGNPLELYSGRVEITSDPAAPQVTSIEQISSNKAKIVFSKSITSDNSTIQNALTVVVDGVPMTVTVVVDGVPMTAGYFTAALDTDDTSKKTVIVTFGSSSDAPHYFYGEDNTSKTLTFIFAENKIEDVFGKKLPATTKNVTMVKDLQGPKAVSVKVTADGEKIEVAFDEEIAATGVSGKMELRRDGIKLTNGISSASRKGTSKGEEKVLVITPGSDAIDADSKLLPGNYTLRLNVGAIADAHTNENEAVNLTFTVAGKTEKLTANIQDNTSTPNVFKIVFSEEVTESALNPANYTLDGKTLPSNTDIYFDTDNTTVVIELPEGTINIGDVTTGTNAVLGVKNVVSKTGKTVVPVTGIVKITDNTPAVLQSAKLLGNTLTLTFNEALGTVPTDIDKLIADFTIEGDGTAFDKGSTAPATAIVAKDGKTLVITIVQNTTSPNDNWNTIKAANKITVTTKDTITKTKDANGVLIKGGVTVTVTK